MPDPRFVRQRRCPETRQGADDSRKGDPAATSAILRRGSVAGGLGIHASAGLRFFMAVTNGRL
jgi:hypothetical protein